MDHAIASANAPAAELRAIWNRIAGRLTDLVSHGLLALAAFLVIASGLYRQLARKCAATLTLRRATSAAT